MHGATHTPHLCVPAQYNPFSVSSYAYRNILPLFLSFPMRFTKSQPFYIVIYSFLHNYAQKLRSYPMHDATQRVMDRVIQLDANQPEFIQAVTSFLSSIDKLVDDIPQILYH